MLRYTTSAPIALIALVVLLACPAHGHANELERLYELALSNDATLQSAGFERAADVEARPQALSQLLPQFTASASADRERAGFVAEQVTNSNSLGASCALSAVGAGGLPWAPIPNRCPERSLKAR